jgi:hypothetical protein
MRSVTLLSLLCSASALAFEVRIDSQGDVVKWQRHVTFVVDPSIARVLNEPNAMDAIHAAIEELDEATPMLEVSLQDGTVRGPGYDLQGKNQNEILALGDWPYTDGALASTVVTLNARTNEIVDTDIVFNVEQHVFRVVGPGAKGDVDDVQNTLTHELGHALGLMHNSEDVTVVMFPSAAAGEIRKRSLQTDDRRGLAMLYSEAPLAELEPTQPRGCSTGGGWSLIAGVVVLAFFAARRPRASVRVRSTSRSRVRPQSLALIVVAAAGAAWAQPVPVQVGVVRSSVAARPADQKGLIVTTLEIDLEACAATVCERAVRVNVPGGRLGDFEQIVEHHPVPAIGERLGLAKKNGRWVVYPLADPTQAARFTALLAGSAAPQASPARSPSSAQVVVPPK